MGWLDSDTVLTVDADELKRAVAFNQTRRAAESDMLDPDFLIDVMTDEEMLHEEEQSDE